LLDKKIGLQLGHNMNLKELAELCDQLEAQGNIIEANNIHNLFIKIASEVEKGHSVKFPMTFEQALEKFSPEEFEVDIDGKWEDTEPISDIKNEYEDLLDDPAAIDDNHIILFDEENELDEDDGPFVVMNMVPEEHMDTLQNNPSKQTKWIKRAED
jgi:hypothetical protein